VSDLISAYAFKESPADQRKGLYTDIMASFADWITETYKVNVLFVPHVIIPNISDDLAVTNDIFRRMRNQDRAKVVRGLYLGNELKGIIGLCEFFIGSRMHATLAALSQKIPTMTYVYNHKAVGINGNILKQQEYLVDIRETKHAELLERSKEVFSLLVRNAVSVSRALEDILPTVIDGSRTNAWMILNLLEIAGPLPNMSNSRLCTGCGACAGVCPSGALAMQYTRDGTLRPRLIKKCNNCKRCMSACPVLGFDMSQGEREVFGHEADDPEIGVVVRAYKGYAKERSIRWESSSGGLVTAIMEHLLKTRRVDAVLSIVDDPQDPLRPKALCISDIDLLSNARGSRYTPVALLDAIHEMPPNVKCIALTGLPCHLWAVRLLERNNLLNDKQVVLRLGLFCGSTPSGQATEFMLREKGVLARDVKKVTYRGNGWPGGLRIETGDDDFFYPLDQIWPFLSAPYFRSLHCFFCRDFFAQLCDLSFGDAWLPECEGHVDGWSLCLARDRLGEDILEECSESLHLEEIPMERVKSAMAMSIAAKCRQGVLKDHVFRKYAPLRAKHATDTRKESLLSRWLIRYEYLLMNCGKSRQFQRTFLDYPFNRFMKVNRRLLSSLKRVK
jgi:coenzyme F420 hydrogenase subunit beta